MLDKLKSRKFWMTFLGALLPLIVQAMTGEVTWAYAVMESLAVLAVGVGVIGAEDVARLKAKSIEKAVAASKDPS